MPTTPSVCLAQLGARRHYAVPTILHSADMLQTLFTDIHAGSRLVRAAGCLLPGRLQPGPLRRLLGRTIDAIPPERIHDFAVFGARRLLAARKDASAADRYRSWVKANSRFGQLVCRSGLGDANTAYVFNGAGLEIIEHARARGLKTIVEQTAADQAWDETLLSRERERWPGWESQVVSEPDWRPLADRELRERELADLVICGSEYVRETVADSPSGADNCVVVPYGFRQVVADKPRTYTGDSLNVLFAGTLCLRKGVPYLLDGARELAPEQRVRIRVVGPPGISDDKLAEVAEFTEYLGTVPRPEMQKHYSWADVFVLPTLSEGSANVCYEALAAGLPVITTPSAGSVVRDGEEGFLVPEHSGPAIAEHILKLLNDPELCGLMSVRALQRAAEYTWPRYAERLLAALQPAPAAEPQTV